MFVKSSVNEEVLTLIKIDIVKNKHKNCTDNASDTLADELSVIDDFLRNDSDNREAVNRHNNSSQNVHYGNEGRCIFLVSSKLETNEYLERRKTDTSDTVDDVQCLKIRQECINKSLFELSAILRAGKSCDTTDNIENCRCEKEEVDKELKPLHTESGRLRSNSVRCLILIGITLRLLGCLILIGILTVVRRLRGLLGLSVHGSSAVSAESRAVGNLVAAF